MTWAKKSSLGFAAWLAGKKKEQATDAPLHAADELLEWQFTFGAEEPSMQFGRVGAAVENVVERVAGVLVRKGMGQMPGQGTCHQYWVVRREVGGGTSEEEVPSCTPGALPRVRGSAGDILLRLVDGSERWYTAHHVRLQE